MILEARLKSANVMSNKNLPILVKVLQPTKLVKSLTHLLKKDTKPYPLDFPVAISFTTRASLKNKERSG